MGCSYKYGPRTKVIKNKEKWKLNRVLCNIVLYTPLSVLKSNYSYMCNTDLKYGFATYVSPITKYIRFLKSILTKVMMLS